MMLRIICSFWAGGDIWSSACRRSRREFFDDDDGYRETGIRGHNNSSPLPSHDIILGTINQFTPLQRLKMAATASTALVRSATFTARRLDRCVIGTSTCRQQYQYCSLSGSSLWGTSRRSSLSLVPRRFGFSTSSLSDDGESSDAAMNNNIRMMPVTRFTEDEEIIRDTVRSWATTELQPIVREMDNEAKLRPEILEGLFAQGFMGMEIPEDFGGSGLSFTSSCLCVEEISRVDPSVAILVDIHNTLTNNAVRFWGSPTLQEYWLPRLATDTVSSFCLSEAGSGSDAFAMKTTATRSADGSYFTLNGSKLWISNAKEAGVFLVFANADPSKGYKGITAFMVDAEAEGIEVGNPENKLGLRASSTCPLMLENVKVDAANVLGDIGLGYRYCINILNEGRIGIAAQQIGIAKGCLDIALPYMMERKQFGQAIADFQGIQHQYAQIATEIHAAEVMTYNACRMKENGIPFVKEASMAKLYSSQTAEKAASKTIEWLGGIGFTKDLLAEKFYRDCKVGSIYEGTSNIQLQTIAKLIQAEYA